MCAARYVASVVAPIRLLLRSAATTDPDLARLLTDLDDERLERMRRHARFLQERGCLRADVTVAQAADVLWACSSAELCEVLVIQRGWVIGHFAGFINDMMISGLLPRPAPPDTS